MGKNHKELARNEDNNHFLLQYPICLLKQFDFINDVEK